MLSTQTRKNIRPTLTVTHEYTAMHILRAPAQHLIANEDAHLPDAIDVTSTSVVGAGQKQDIYGLRGAGERKAGH